MGRATSSTLRARALPAPGSPATPMETLAVSVDRALTVQSKLRIADDDIPMNIETTATLGLANERLFGGACHILNTQGLHLIGSWITRVVEGDVACQYRPGFSCAKQINNSCR